MANQTKGKISLTLLFIIVFAILTTTTQHEGSTEKSNEEDGTGAGTGGSVPVERAIGMPPILTSRWSAVIDWAKLAWINLRQPESWYGNSKTGKVKEVVTQSFEMGKETIEYAADSAAKAAGNAADAAKKTLERTVSIHPRREDQDNSAEL